MATLVEPAEMETLGGQAHVAASPTSSGPSQHFNDGKFYLLVVIGEITSEEHLKCAIADIEKGKMERGEAGAGLPAAELGRTTWQQMRTAFKFVEFYARSSAPFANNSYRLCLTLLLLLFAAYC